MATDGFDDVTREKFDKVAKQVEAEWDQLRRSPAGRELLAEIDAAVKQEDS